MTLADVLPNARKLSASEKLKLIRILAEDLDTAENIAPLEPFKTYELPTPYDSFGAGKILLDMASHTQTRKKIIIGYVPNNVQLR